MSSNRSTQQQQPGTSAISQINQLKPIPGIDDGTEDITQRPVGAGAESNRQPTTSTTVSMMKDVDPKSTRQKAISPKSSALPSTSASTIKDINQSQMGSVMGNSTMGSVIRPVDLQSQQKPHEESSDNSTVFIKTKAVSRPAIVKEPNNWVKKQNVDMTRALPLGIQPGDIDAKKLMHSHTGVPSRINSNTAVSAAPASSPTPIQPFPDVTTSREKSNNPGKNKSNELFEPSPEQFQLRRKPSQQQQQQQQPQQTTREKKQPVQHQVRTHRSATPPPVFPSKSAPNSPNAHTSGAATTTSASTSMSQSKSTHGKESFFSKFAKNLLPSSSSSQPNTAPSTGSGGGGLPPKSKSATSIYERKKTKPKESDRK